MCLNMSCDDDKKNIEEHQTDPLNMWLLVFVCVCVVRMI